MTDFAKLDTVAGSNEGITVRLFHPGSKEDLDTTIRVLGCDSDSYKAKVHERQQARTKKAMRGGVFAAVTPPSPQEIDKAAIELLAAVTVSWEGVEFAGEKLACTFENAVRFYTEVPWAREQVDAEVHDRRNFTKS